MMRVAYFAAIAVMDLVRAAPLAHPHIFVVIVDDLGWGDVSYHREAETVGHIQTPTIDALVKDGVELNRHYAHMVCTPTRASFQSGRLPVHLTTQLTDVCDPVGAIPRNMTGLAQVMKRAGYATHQVGKWDAGMATPKHTPQGRGYDTSLNYFGHGNWMYSLDTWRGSYENRGDIPDWGPKDLWDTDHPATDLNGTAYEELLFRDRMIKILYQHDQSTPLFLQYSSRIAHYPLQAPPEYQERFKHISFENRRMYAAMIAFLDDQLASVTTVMRELGMWDNTLMVLFSDNGGYVQEPLGRCNTTEVEWPGTSMATDFGHGTVCHNGESGASNFPLRGGKYDSFEGGIRVTAFMSGGFVPSQMRGRRLESMMHVADWYRTLSEGIAGIDPTDTEAKASGLPPIDSLNMWPTLIGKVEASPRDTVGILVDKSTLLFGKWKYIEGGKNMHGASVGNAEYPTEVVERHAIGDEVFTCPPAGCLFDVVMDPAEEHDLSEQIPEQVRWMQAEMGRQRASIWSIDALRTPTDGKACNAAARDLYHGFLGPFMEVSLPEGTHQKFRRPGLRDGKLVLRTVHKS